MSTHFLAALPIVHPQHLHHLCFNAAVNAIAYEKTPQDVRSSGETRTDQSWLHFPKTDLVVMKTTGRLSIRLDDARLTSEVSLNQRLCKLPQKNLGAIDALGIEHPFAAFEITRVLCKFGILL